MRTAAGALVGLALGGAFYLLLIDTASLPELYAGAGATALAGAAYEVSREHGFAEASLALAWLTGTWRVLRRVPLQIAFVSGEAIAQLVHPRRSRGRFRSVSFDACGEDSRDVGRRALAEALGSLAPNTIVVGVDADRRLILVHQLHRHGGREELDPLELG
jgi:hypothetical protein